MGRIERIWIKPARGAPMEATESGVLEAGRGLAGNANQGGERQVTIIETRRWSALEREAGTALDPAWRRANLLVSGVDLEESTGKTLQIGPCSVLIHGMTRPCAQMDAAHEGLQELMKTRWGGGAYGEVVAGGTIAVGDPVGWKPTT